MTGTKLTPQQLEQVREIRQTIVERLAQTRWSKRLGYNLQAAILLPLMSLFAALPLDRASAFGGWVGRVIAARFIDYELIARTMRVPFPNFTDKQVRQVSADMCDNIGRTLAELPHLKDFAGAGNPRVRIIGAEHVTAARATGKGVLFVTGHFGNWEVSEVAVRALGLDGVVVVDHPRNPHFTARLALMRMEAGISEQIGTGFGVYRVLRKRLKDGAFALALVDQRVRNGIKAPFCGLETTTNVIPARLARTLDVPVIPMAVRRLEGAHFEVVFEAPLQFQSSGDEAVDERAFMGRVNAFYEHEIRRRPAHWLWGHPRWDDVFLGIEPRRAPRSGESG